MGGGGDSRIPSLLRKSLQDYSISVVCRTYSFDPEIAHGQIKAWINELTPQIIIAESLGALHALRIHGIPCLFISPALNAPFYFELMAWLALLPGVTWIFDRIYRPKEGDRQLLHFTFPLLRKYRCHRRTALLSHLNTVSSPDSMHAFFGTQDHYRRSGVVSIKTWKRYFGNTFSIYEGSHFMEEEHIYDMLIPVILNMFNINQ